MNGHATSRLSERILAVALATLCAAACADDGATRPRMRQLSPGPSGARPPDQRELVDARAALERRFRGTLARASTAAGATAAAAALLDAAAGEDDRALKWLMLAEARRLAAAAGDADAVDRSILLADATFEFDAVAEELRILQGIPLRALDGARAATLAKVAEGLADRAEFDGRLDATAAAWTLALRGWQRAGDADGARRAARRRAEVESWKTPGLP